MAQEFVRFVGGQHAGNPKDPFAPTGTDMIPVGPAPPRPSEQPPLRTGTYITRESLVAQHGEAIGAVMHEVVVRKRHEEAERLRTLQAQLSLLRADMEPRVALLAAIEREDQPAIDAAYQHYLDLCAALQARKVSVQSEIAQKSGAIDEIIRALNAPVHSSQVTNWLATSDERGPAKGRQWV